MSSVKKHSRHKKSRRRSQSDSPVADSTRLRDQPLEPNTEMKGLKDIEKDIRDIRHDLKDRLNTVDGYLQLSQMSSDEEKEKYIKLSLEQLRKVAVYIDDTIK